VSGPAGVWRALVLCTAAAFALAAAVAAHAAGPEVGGSVPSVLSLSLNQLSGFTAAGGGRRGPRGHLYVATIGLSVTSTEMPTRLSITDGEALRGADRGRLLKGKRSLSPALEVAAGHGRYHSLDSGVDPQLKQWSEPIAEQAASIHLRQAYRGSAHSLSRFHKLLLVTVTAGGP
jgi:hypothetical protein